MVKVELDTWYDKNTSGYILPFDKNYVELRKEHAFLSIPLVINYFKQIENKYGGFFESSTIIVSIEKHPNMNRNLQQLFNSGIYRLYEWTGESLNWKFDTIFPLFDFKVKSEFSLEILIEKEKKKRTYKKFGI
jgi:hypothetical protein